MRSIYVGFSVPTSKWKVGSLLIRWAETPGWFKLFFSSHVFTMFPPIGPRQFYMVHEAAGEMVRFMSESHFKSHANVLQLYRFKFDEADIVAMELACASTCGTPYAFWENVGIAYARAVRGLTGRVVRNPFGNGLTSQKCSELVIRNVIIAHLENIGLTLPQIAAAVTLRTGLYCPVDADMIGVADLWHMVQILVERGDVEPALMAAREVA